MFGFFVFVTLVQLIGDYMLRDNGRRLSLPAPRSVRIGSWWYLAAFLAAIFSMASGMRVLLIITQISCVIGVFAFGPYINKTSRKYQAAVHKAANEYLNNKTKNPPGNPGPDTQTDSPVTMETLGYIPHPTIPGAYTVPD